MVVWVETHITQGACAYPITSSTTMGGGYQVEVANGKHNLWGEELAFVEPESEHSAASTCEGFAVSGGRVTNFTSGQGLILMKEVLYTISGKRLPVVFHIGARALTSQSLNVHAGHDDVYGVADCGWGVLFARNAQEAGDLALIARRAAEETETPFLNVQDGSLTTDTIANVRLAEPELMQQLVAHPSKRTRPLFDPRVLLLSGIVQSAAHRNEGRIRGRCVGNAGLSGTGSHAAILRRFRRIGQPRCSRRRFHRDHGKHAQQEPPNLLHRRHQARDGASNAG